MRIPIIEPYNETAPEETLFLPAEFYERDPLTLVTDKDKVAFFKSVEKMVRGSYEYKEYIGYLINSQQMNVCSAFDNLGKDLARSIRLEIHHEPFTLYDIVYIIYLRFINKGKEVNVFDLAEEVLKTHFLGRVGLLPLSKTVHELVHVGKVFIPLQYLDEGFLAFYHEYKEEIHGTPLEEILMKKIEVSKTFNFRSNSVLQKKYIYIKNEKYDNVPEKLVV